MSVWEWIAGYVILATGCFALLGFTGGPSPRTIGRAAPMVPPIIDQLALIVAALLLMAVVGCDLQRRIHTA